MHSRYIFLAIGIKSAIVLFCIVDNFKPGGPRSHTIPGIQSPPDVKFRNHLFEEVVNDRIDESVKYSKWEREYSMNEDTMCYQAYFDTDDNRRLSVTLMYSRCNKEIIVDSCFAK